jgi:hypothetical protein
MPSDKDQIESLNEENYDTWIINARAKLRQKKLWTVCQTPLSASASAALKEKHTNATDILIPTLSKSIKIKLIEAKQNDGYLLWEKLKALFTPAKDQLFYTSSREYFLSNSTTAIRKNSLYALKFLMRRLIPRKWSLLPTIVLSLSLCSVYLRYTIP